MYLKGWKKYVVSVIISGCMLVVLSACATGEADDAVEESTGTEVVEQTVEETSEVQEPVEETVEVATEVVEESTEEVAQEAEVSTENLTDEEWFKSLNLNDARFLIFNDTTGERKVLENGQEYTLVEGDKLAYWYPLDWKYGDLTPWYLYTDTELKFDCIFITLNYDNINPQL